MTPGMLARGFYRGLFEIVISADSDRTCMIIALQKKQFTDSISSNILLERDVKVQNELVICDV